MRLLSRLAVWQCGKIREIKITKQTNFHVATVEFLEKVSRQGSSTVVSLILGFSCPLSGKCSGRSDKGQKKRINDHEISVHLAWQSTLYVTNFPEKADDEYMRQLFGKVSQFD